MHYFKLMDSPVGELKLVANEKGLEAILWKNEKPNRVRLGAMVENADHPTLIDAERQLRDYFMGKRTRFDIELDPAGTEFQKKVWDALNGIPHGETRSYAQIAETIGAPKAVRAVGAAIGRNPLSIVTPCHRVIGSNGSLTGFAGGLATKEHLLSHEEMLADGVKEVVMTLPVSNTAKRETLRFGFGNTTLGVIAVARSEQGVVALFMGDDPAKLERDLREAFPDAILIRDQDGMAETITKAESLVNAPQLGSELSPDLRGSAVEIAVWNALRRIPAGETRTYGAIAQSLPIKATAQEVGAACAANRIAILIPCHRIVKSDGKIGGYRWGVRRKYRLINMEGVSSDLAT